MNDNTGFYTPFLMTPVCRGPVSAHGYKKAHPRFLLRLSTSLLLALTSTAVSYAGPQRDAVCQGSCGGGCGPCPTTVVPQAPAPPDPNRALIIERVDYLGDFFVVTSDGRHLSGRDAAHVGINNGARVVTGPSGKAVIQLPDDGTAWTLGPDSELTIDSFVYDPDSGERAVTMDFVKGFFRWASGRVGRPRYRPTVKLPVGTLRLRGTDGECVVEPGGSGYIKLTSGEAGLADYDTTIVRAVPAGKTVRFAQFTVTSP